MGAPHMAKQLMCFGVAPAPVYKGARGRRPAGPYWRARSPPPPSRSRTPTRRGKEGGEGEGKRGGAAAPPPSPIRTRGRGGVRPTLAAPLSFHQGPCGPLSLPGGFR